MNLKMNGFWTTGCVVALAAALAAQAPAPAPQADTQRPTFSVQIDLVTNDVIVRDSKGNFVPDLKREDFEILEDGIKQDITSMTVVTGGRVTNVLAPPPAPPPEGIILPPQRQTNDASGRIFLFFVDDLHMEFQNTPRIRDLFKRISKNLLHDGDLWGMVSSGPSSIAIDMNYDRQRFESAVNKITGNGLKPSDIIQSTSGAEGPAEVRYRAHTAFSTVTDALKELEKVHNRRKAFVYVSDGYDFKPFQKERLGLYDANSPFQQNMAAQLGQQDRQNTGPDQMAQQQQTNEEFADADLARELAEIGRSANRANVTMYTIDPRGLVGGADIGENVDPSEWQNYLRTSQDSLRTIAEMTGGIAVVNQNDFDKALKKIDAETSDYYVLGYYSKNPDPLRRRRTLEVRVARPGLSVWSRKEYVLRPNPPSTTTKAAPGPDNKEPPKKK